MVEQINNLKNDKIKALESKGFKRWQKAGYDRLYVNASVLGLVCEYYNTGNIKHAEFNGEEISNCRARKMKFSKTFLDVKTWKVYSDNEDLKAVASSIVAAV